MEIDVTSRIRRPTRKPFTVRVNWRLFPGDQLIEFVCNENQQFVPKKERCGPAPLDQKRDDRIQVSARAQPPRVRHRPRRRRRCARPASACFRPRSDQPLRDGLLELRAIDLLGLVEALRLEQRGAEPVDARKRQRLGLVVGQRVLRADGALERRDRAGRSPAMRCISPSRMPAAIESRFLAVCTRNAGLDVSAPSSRARDTARAKSRGPASGARTLREVPQLRLDLVLRPVRHLQDSRRSARTGSASAPGRTCRRSASRSPCRPASRSRPDRRTTRRRAACAGCARDRSRSPRRPPPSDPSATRRDWRAPSRPSGRFRSTCATACG